MTEYDTNKQPTNETNEKKPFGAAQGQQPTSEREPSFGQPETGEAQAETLTETQPIVDEDNVETTGEAQGGFVASKQSEEESAYLQERGETEKKDDIEGSSNFATNGE